MSLGLVLQFCNHENYLSSHFIITLDTLTTACLILTAQTKAVLVRSAHVHHGSLYRCSSCVLYLHVPAWVLTAPGNSSRERPSCPTSLLSPRRRLFKLRSSIHTLADSMGGGNVFVGEQARRTSQLWAWCLRATLAWWGLWIFWPWWWQSRGSCRFPLVDPLSLLTLSPQSMVENFSTVTPPRFPLLSSPCLPHRLSSMAWISRKFLQFLVSDFSLAIYHPGSASPLSVLRMTEHRITSLDKIINASLSNCQ